MGGRRRSANKDVPDRVSWSDEAPISISGVAFVAGSVAFVAFGAFLLGNAIVFGIWAFLFGVWLARQGWLRLRTLVELRWGRGTYVRIGDYLVTEVTPRGWTARTRTIQQHWVELRELDGDVPFAWVVVGESDAWTLREQLVVAMWTLRDGSTRCVLTGPELMAVATSGRSSPPPDGVRPI